MIPESAFQDIINELERQPLPVNNYRAKAGNGRSQTFGLVYRRCLPPDYSRLCWMRPKLYKLLLDFAEKYVTIPFTSITVNQNYQAKKHKDKGNVGLSFLVAFGDYEGGELVMYKEEGQEKHNIKYSPIIDNFSTTWHEVLPFSGTRYSLVFYQADGRGINFDEFPKPSVIEKDGKYIFKRGEEIITEGLDHPLRKKKPTNIQFTIEKKTVIIDFK